jgi:hypothetical protein
MRFGRADGLSQGHTRVESRPRTGSAYKTFKPHAETTLRMGIEGPSTHPPRLRKSNTLQTIIASCPFRADGAIILSIVSCKKNRHSSGQTVSTLFW